jgi:flagellar biosynthesis component FlhA
MNKIKYPKSVQLKFRNETVFNSVAVFLVRTHGSERHTETRSDFVLDQSAPLFTFSLSANHNAGNEKITPRGARKYCRLLGLP